MLALVIFVIGYPVALGALVALDWATGWVIADAFGKDEPHATGS
jgi:hypothetical protein